MSPKLPLADLILSDPVDLRMKSDGRGEFPDGYELTVAGRVKISKALGVDRFAFADYCGCPAPEEGDGVHVSGEPSDLICLASPMASEPTPSVEEE